MIAAAELEIFKLLSEPKSIGAIARAIGISDATTSRYINKLVKNGLAQKYREGKRVFVTRTDSTHAQALTTFIREFPRLPLSDIFSYSALYILSVIRAEKSVSQISLITGLSRTIVYTAINRLTKIGVILKSRGYFVNPNHRVLQKFIDAYFSYLNFKKLEAIAPNSIILWLRGYEFLFKSKYPVKHKNVNQTATSKFHSYGLQIVPAENYYYNTARELCISEDIIHTILADPNSLRNNMYACLLYQKMHPEDIINWGAIYDIQDQIETLIAYLDNKQKNSEFVPPWEEYVALAKDYGLVKVR